MLTGLILAVIAIATLLRYSPYENPGALPAGMWLATLAVVLIGAPAVLLAGSIIAGNRRRYRAWLATLTPEQRTAARLAAGVAALGADLAWHEHNKRKDARLSASVMGMERRD
jgi:hypothetical protein